MHAKLGEVYCFRLHGGGYGAAQVVAEKLKSKSSSVQLLRLGIDTDEPPTAQQVGAAQSSHNGDEDDECERGLWVPSLAPWWAQRVDGHGPAPATREGGLGRLGRDHLLHSAVRAKELRFSPGVAPIRERLAELARDPGHILNVLRQRTAVARELTQATLAEVRDALGLFRLGA